MLSMNPDWKFPVRVGSSGGENMSAKMEVN